jgi:hypothetical protein
MSRVTLPPLPTFLIIGAQKSATRWLRSNLGEHPEIYTAPEELHAFVKAEFAPRTIKRYRKGFANWAGEPYVGESTPGYMMLRHSPERTAARIDGALPDVRLIALLRNPVDRAQSALVHHIARKRLPKDTRLVEFIRTNEADLEEFSLISGGLYAASLEPYLDRFGDRLLVLLHDDLKADAASLYHTALRHIGARDDWLPPNLTEVRFSNQTGASGSDADATAAKASSRRRPPAGSSAAMPPGLTDADRRELYEYFRDDVAHLGKLIDRDLSGWDPENA